MKVRFFLLCFLVFPVLGKTSKILCELDGTYSVTYKDIKKNISIRGHRDL